MAEAQATKDDAAPRRFGRYELVTRIGVGGMAEVWKARVAGIGGFEKMVVVKKILPAFAQNRAFVEMLLAEARLCAVLHHANIVQTYENGEIDGQFYIAMEYVSGHDLYQTLARATQIKQRLPVQLAMFIAAEAARGLAYAHSATDNDGRPLQIIHRDVSPSNLIISKLGEVKITDFGVARAALEGPHQDRKSRAGVLKGKLGYMSPEQVTGQSFDRRSDIFSLGIILYESVTLKRLFLGRTDLETLVNIRDARIEHKFRKHAYIPEGVRVILRRALARNPDDRYANALDMYEDISNLLFESKIKVTNRHVAEFMDDLFDPEVASGKKEIRVPSTNRSSRDKLPPLLQAEPSAHSLKFSELEGSDKIRKRIEARGREKEASEAGLTVDTAALDAAAAKQAQQPQPATGAFTEQADATRASKPGGARGQQPPGKDSLAEPAVANNPEKTSPDAEAPTIVVASPYEGEVDAKPRRSSGFPTDDASAPLSDPGTVAKIAAKQREAVERSSQRLRALASDTHQADVEVVERSDTMVVDPDAIDPVVRGAVGRRRTTGNMEIPKFHLKMGDGQILGPLSRTNLEGLVNARATPSDAMVSLDDGESYRPIRELTGIRQLAKEVESGRGEPTASGDLDRFVFPKLLYGYGVGRATGCLELRRGNAIKSMYLRRGRPQHIASNQRGEMLGGFMVANGYISKSDLGRALRRIDEQGGRLGDTLIALNIIKPFQLYQVLEKQFRAKLVDAFGWDGDRWAFFDGDTPPPDLVPLDIDPIPMLTEGVREKLSLSTLEPYLKAWFDVPFVRQSNPKISVEQLRFQAREAKALGLLMASKTLREAVETRCKSRQQRLSLLHVVFLLRQTGQLKFETG